MGVAWENEHASWAADMLTAARYPLTLDPTLRTGHLIAAHSHTRPATPPDSTAPATRHR